PGEVAPCVPGCEKVEVTGENSYRATVRVALGPIKTAFNVNVELTAQEAPHFAASVTRGEESGKPSTPTAHSELRPRDLGGSATEVSYSSEVSLFGRMGKYGLGIMKKKAEAIGREFADSFAARVEGGAKGS